MKGLSEITKHCNAADEVFNELEALASDREAKWVFRGVENSEYGLTPSIFRQPETIKSWLSITEPYPEKLEDQLRNEIKLLQKYFSAANQIGLPIPGNWQYVLDHNLIEWEPTNIESSSSYSFKNVLEFMSVAQHYGVPTRLLDFSFSFENALYFACKDFIDIVVARVQGKARALEEVFHGGVWAINLNYIEANKKSPIDHYVTPYCNNNNIRAQKGLFVIQKYFYKTWAESQPALSKDPKAYDTTKLNLFIDLQEFFKSDLDKVIKFIRFSEIHKYRILDRLNTKGINLYTLMPSLENVTKYFMINPKFDAEKENYQRSLILFETMRQAMHEIMVRGGLDAKEDDDIGGVLEELR